MKYDFLKEFKVEKEFEDSQKRHVFYPVPESDIKSAEERADKIFPEELKDFFTEIGYGYFEDPSECFTNLLMSPAAIADFICGEGNYSYAEEREFLKEDDMVFFEVDSGCHITLKISGAEKGAVFFGKRKLSDSFAEFIKKLNESPNFYTEK